MRIALVAYGTRGDVQPLLALARGLEGAGHVPLLCAAPDFGGWARQLGVDFRPLGSPMHRFFTLSQYGHLGLLVGLRRELARHAREIEAAVSSADLILWTTAEAAVPTVAEALGIPCRYVSFCPQMLSSPAHTPPFGPWFSGGRRFNELTWGIARGAVNAFGRAPLNRLRSERGLEPISDVLSHAVPTRAILAADPVLAPVPEELRPVALQTGAWVLREEGELDPRIERFLEVGEPPVYIGFGSVSDGRAERTRSVLLDAVAKVGCRALVAVGGTSVTRLAPGVLGVGATPHRKLFPGVAAVVHHGGAGVTTAAARAGTPQVVVPHLLDQFYWGRRIHALGLGPAPIRRPRLTARRLAAALREALDETVRRRAQELSRVIRDDGVARTVRFLEREYGAGHEPVSVAQAAG